MKFRLDVSFNGRARVWFATCDRFNDENPGCFYLHPSASFGNDTLASDTESEKPAEPKFEIGDCILNTNPNHSWYSKEAEVFDIYQSSRYEAQMYILYLRTKFMDTHTYGFYDTWVIDKNAVKVGTRLCRD